MMRMRMTLVVTFLLATGLAAPGAAGGEKEQPKEKTLRGDWKVVSVEMYGKEAASAATFKRGVWVITDDKLILKIANDSVTIAYRRDATRKPTTFDLTPTSGPDKGRTALGIYTLDADTLTICYGKTKRPTEFATKAGVDRVLMVFKRQKK